MSTKPVQIGLVFFYCFSSSSFAQTPSALNLFWYEASEANASKPELLSRFASGVRWQGRYENWLEERDKSSATVGDYHHRRLSVLNTFEEDKWSFSAYVSAEASEQQWYKQEQDWSFSAKQSEQSLDAAFHLQQRWFGLGAFTKQHQQGFLLKFKPLQDWSVFYKKQSWQQQWDITGYFQREDSEDPLAPSKLVHYDYQIPIDLQCELYGAGVSYQGEYGWAQYQQQKDGSACDFQSAEWAVSPFENWQIQGQYNQVTIRPQRTTSLIDDKPQGINDLSTDLERVQLALQYQTKQRHWQLFGLYSQFRLEDVGKFNAAAMGGIWSSLLVGLGQYQGNLDLTIRHAGIRSHSRPKQGWQNGFELGLADVGIDATSAYRINGFPFGVIDKGSDETDIESAQLAMLGFSFGYRWSSWQLQYQIQQPIPISVKRKSDDSGSGGDDSGGSFSSSDDWTDVFDKWPAGNRQTLTVYYHF